jgi:hypothetical protein
MWKLQDITHGFVDGEGGKTVVGAAAATTTTTKDYANGKSEVK